MAKKLRIFPTWERLRALMAAGLASAPGGPFLKELLTPDKKPEEPPPTSPTSVAHPVGDLPRSAADTLADFVGREEELAGLEKQIRETRAAGITGVEGLHGMGGVGKTALALRLAERLKPDFPDGQILYNFRGTDPEPRNAEKLRAHDGLAALRPDGDVDGGRTMLDEPVAHHARDDLVRPDANNRGARGGKKVKRAVERKSRRGA